MTNLDDEGLRPPSMTDSAAHLLQAILDSSDALIMVLDHTGHIVRFNRACELLTGYSEAEAVGQAPWRLLLPPNAAEEYQSTFQKTICSYAPEKREGDWIAKDGTRHFISWSSTVIGNLDGTTAFYVTTGLDLTHQRQAVEDLRSTLLRLQHTENELRRQNKELAISRNAARAEQRRYQELFHSAPDGYIVTTADGLITEVNRAIEVLLYARTENLVGKNLIDFVSGGDRRRFRMQMEKLGHALPAQEWELRLEPRIGGSFPASVTVAAVKNTEGATVALRWLIHDISQRRRSQEALRKRTRDLDRRVRALNCLYAMSNLAGQTELSIPEIARRTVALIPPAWKHPRVTCARLTYGDQVLATPDFRETPWKLCANIVVRKETVGQIEVCYLEEMPHTEIGPFLEDERNVLNMLAERFATVIGQRRAEKERAAIEEHLHQAQKMEAIGQLASGVSHDFNNLLTVIRGASERLRLDLEGNAAALEGLEIVEQATSQAMDVTRSLLTFTREVPGERHPIDLKATVRESANLLKRVLPASVTLDVEASEEGPVWCNGDSSQLRRIVLNLAINARDAMPKGGQLRILVDQVDEPIRLESDEVDVPPENTAHWARIIVMDTGEGMPPEVQSRIFEPFFTTKPRGQGTGLGLAVVHGIVKEHGGQIDIQSKVKQGSVFTIKLPAITNDRSSPREVAQTPEHGHGELILLAETNAHLRGLVAMLLESLGYQVVLADDEAGLCEAIREHRNEARLLIVEDLIPGCSTDNWLKKVRGKGATMPAIILTSTDVKSASDSSDPSAHMLQKPFRMPELGVLVNEVLNASQDKGTQV